MIRLRQIQARAAREAEEQVARTLRVILGENDTQTLGMLLEQTRSFVVSWKRMLNCSANLEEHFGCKVFRCPLPFPMIAYIQQRFPGYELRFTVYGVDDDKDWHVGINFDDGMLRCIGDTAAEYICHSIEDALVRTLRDSLRGWMHQIAAGTIETLRQRNTG